MILFDRGPLDEPCLFETPRALIVADREDQVPAALAALVAAQGTGAWIAGYASYELGYALEPRLRRAMPNGRRVPLLAFGVFDGPVDGARVLAEADAAGGQARLQRPVPLLDAAGYAEKFGRLAAYIADGDCYQVNLTFPLRAMSEGPALGLYGALRRRQPVRHGAYVALGDGPTLLSRSPELFFRIDADRQIEVRPMKGTAPREGDPARDAAAREALAGSTKDRAENLMIVDLLRNDIGRLCEPGTVAVPSLFEVETYATVHQMVSRVVGRLQPRATLADVLAALFPCGSVTGAPKIRAMEIIRELEDAPRDAYCGAIGWAAPDGRACFNVAIRTLTMFDGGEVVLNVGGGVVHDSTAEGEYREALWKARFAQLG